MKKIIALLLAVMMVVSLCACGSTSASTTSTTTTTTTTTTEAKPATETSDVIKIGYIGDLTGSTSIWGQYGKYGAELAVKDINEKGGVLGGKKLELVPMDGKGEAADSVNAFKKLVTESGIVASVGTNFSSCNIPMAAVADEVKVPIIGTAASNELVTIDEKGNLHPYSFRMCFLDSYIGTAIGNYSADKGYKTAALFTVAGDTNSESVGQFVKDAFVAKGGKIVAEEQCQSGEQEFRAQLGKIKTANPDVIFCIINNYAMIAAFAKQAREMGIEVPLIGHDGWDSQELADLANGALDGCYYVSRIGFSDPAAKEFGERVNKEYKLDSAAETECLFGYDGISWIAQCIEKAGSADPTAIRDALENTDVFKGYIGTLVMDAKTHNPTMACELYTFNGTERVSVQEIAAA